MSVSLWLRTSFFVVWVVRGKSGINPLELAKLRRRSIKRGINALDLQSLARTTESG